eukprot:s5575_g3.t1
MSQPGMHRVRSPTPDFVVRSAWPLAHPGLAVNDGGSMARRAARLLALAGAGLVFTAPRLRTAILSVVDSRISGAKSHSQVRSSHKITKT